MQPSKHPKAWVLTTSQDFTPNGVLQLGQLLTDPWDPNSAVLAEGTAPVPLAALRDQQKHKEVDFSSFENEQVSFRTWLRSRSEIIPAEGDIQAAQTSASWAKYRSSIVMTDIFQPSDAYAEAAVQAGKSSRRTQLRLWEWTKALYLVTGQRILASGTSVDSGSQRAADYHIGAAANTTPANVPFEGRLEVGNESASGQSQSLGDTSAFVYAYRLHKVLKRHEPDTASVEPWVHGELHRVSGGDGREENRVNLDIGEDEMGDEDEIMDEDEMREDGMEDDEMEEESRDLVKVERDAFEGDGSQNDMRVVE